ncbi:MAG: PQQ-binding-like beta-propeller repeat protein [Verrucomicrobiota bacterium]
MRFPIPSPRVALPMLALMTGFGATAATSEVQNWPAWRGPLGNGVAPGANPPMEWSESRNVVWKVAVPGRGSSTPIVWGDQVFLLTAIPEGVEPPTPGEGPEGSGRGGPGGRGGRGETPSQPQRFTVIALGRDDGKVRWQQTARVQVPHEGHHKDHGFASASPVTDGRVLIASFGSFGVFAYDLKGKLIWEKDLGDMRTRNSFGEGSSPALHGTTVVVLWDHEGEDFIVALDTRDGRELWRQRRDEPTGWSTPLIVEHGGKTQVVVNGTNKVRAYDLATGSLLWECSGQTANAIPTPVADQGSVIVMSGFRGSALQVIRLGGSGDLRGTDAIVWSHNKGTPYVPSPLLYGGRLYFLSGNTAMLSIFDARTGKPEVEMERLNGLTGVYASPVGAAGRVYLAGREGGVVVLKEGPKVEVLATNRLDDGFDASPAVAGNRLYLRGRVSLYCLGEPKP